jgi:hypothetical protein
MFLLLPLLFYAVRLERRGKARYYAVEVLHQGAVDGGRENKVEERG